MRPPSAAQSRAVAVAPAPRGFPVVACLESIARGTRCLLLTHTSITLEKVEPEPTRRRRSRSRAICFLQAAHKRLVEARGVPLGMPSARPSELPHCGSPQGGGLAGTRTSRRLLAYRGVHHDQAALRVDKDRLAADSEQREHASLTGKDPRLVAVAEEAGRDPRPKMRLIASHRGGVSDPRSRVNSQDRPLRYEQLPG